MNIFYLPTVLLVKIFQNVDSQDVFRLGRCCKTFHHLIFSSEENGKGKEIWKHHNVRALNSAKTNSELLPLFDQNPISLIDMMRQVKFFIAMNSFCYSSDPERCYIFINRLVQLGNSKWLNLFFEIEKRRINSSETIKNPLFIACRKKNAEVIKVLMNDDRIAVGLFHGLSILGEMIQEKNLEITKLLLSFNKFEINDFHWILLDSRYTPLGLAINNDDAEMLSLILEQKGLNLSGAVFSTPFEFFDNI